jgi:hypothetical protein
MHQFPKFTPAWNSTCFGKFLCPSSGVYSLYTRHWYMSYKFEDSFRSGPGWNCSSILVLLENCLQTCMTYTSADFTVNKLWWWAEELPETCRVSCRSKFGKLVHLIGFIIKKFVTMHGHMNAKYREVVYIENKQHVFGLRKQQTL